MPVRVEFSEESRLSILEPLAKEAFQIGLNAGPAFHVQERQEHEEVPAPFRTGVGRAVDVAESQVRLLGPRISDTTEPKVDEGDGVGRENSMNRAVDGEKASSGLVRLNQKVAGLEVSVVHANVRLEMGEHGRQVQKNVQNERGQVGRGGNQIPQGPGVLDEVHREGNAPVQKAEDVVDTGSACGKGAPVQRLPHDLLYTGLVQKALARQKGRLDKHRTVEGRVTEFDATKGGARKGPDSGEGSCVKGGGYDVLGAGNSDSGEEGRTADTSLP